jgi:hypothetical protein
LKSLGFLKLSERNSTLPNLQPAIGIVDPTQGSGCRAQQNNEPAKASVLVGLPNGRHRKEMGRYTTNSIIPPIALIDLQREAGCSGQGGMTYRISTGNRPTGRRPGTVSVGYKALGISGTRKALRTKKFYKENNAQRNVEPMVRRTDPTQQRSRPTVERTELTQQRSGPTVKRTELMQQRSGPTVERTEPAQDGGNVAQ